MYIFTRVELLFCKYETQTKYVRVRPRSAHSTKFFLVFEFLLSVAMINNVVKCVVNHRPTTIQVTKSEKIKSASSLKNVEKLACVENGSLVNRIQGPAALALGGFDDELLDGCCLRLFAKATSCGDMLEYICHQKRRWSKFT